MKYFENCGNYDSVDEMLNKCKISVLIISVISKHRNDQG